MTRCRRDPVRKIALKRNPLHRYAYSAIVGEAMNHLKSEVERLVKPNVGKRAKERRVPLLSQVDLDAAGIDVGATSHFVAVPEDRDEHCVREFGAFTVDLYRLADWLKGCGVETVAMESTGVYWIPYRLNKSW